MPEDENNLVFRAALALQKAAKISKGAHIRVVKRIPVGAGLGGGSSDAASALLALNKLLGLRLRHEQLSKIAVKLGADVPFFLLPDTAALGEGIGDILTPVNIQRRIWIVLVYPDINISTKEIYEALPRRLTKKNNNVKLLIYALRDFDVERAGKLMFNRLEGVAFKKYRQLAAVKRDFSALGVKAVLMSGSGSSVFGIVNSREEAISIRTKLRGIYKTKAVRSL